MLEAVAETARAPSGGTSCYLSVENLQAWYGDSHVLHGMSFNVQKGEVVTLLGRNGAGKTTTMKSIIGLIQKRTGSIYFDGRELIKLPPRAVARAGIGFCPEERGIYSSLSVRENLLLPPTISDGGFTTGQVLDLFPNLRERLQTVGTKLSGGEQQMLAIGRILRTGAKMLLLDEPTEGLAPVIVQQIGRIITLLKQRGYTILLVEQNFHFASSVADRHYVVELGRIVDMFRNEELDANQEKLKRYLGV
ncbi:ABC transporter ATP-binding protein [Rhizobium sp. C4]|uniref:ABC transporter ATP-binding protein n=1 Tax=Rhizobium sp. C4 TaxID=1349800 RepID=UPI001E33AE49|nr:ABC transporter ATP-binding protein [Rhizobium sp. C4]MCD2175182.1 ABC transporter ATP-binding protein [Rhizobium sp. C4]